MAYDHDLRPLTLQTFSAIFHSHDEWHVSLESLHWLKSYRVTGNRC